MKPILFNTQMVRAICKGEKTVTRRLIKLSDLNPTVKMVRHPDNPKHVALLVQWPSGKKALINPPVQPGDMLYVRETWSFWPCFDCDNEMCCGRGISYKETDGCFVYKTQESKVPYEEKWRPSIHMPKEAARIFLKVTDVKASRLHDMEIEDFRKEGIRLSTREEWNCKCNDEAEDCRDKPCEYRSTYLDAMYRRKFAELWDSTIQEDRYLIDSFEKNPLVWEIEFVRCSSEQVKEGVLFGRRIEI